jgi:hypothetical protein
VSAATRSNGSLHAPNCHYCSPGNTTLTRLCPLPGPSRCFPFWQELLSCYVVNSSDDDDSGKKKCVPAMEDYYECLHHRKEVRRPQSKAPSQTARTALADPDCLLYRPHE